MISQLGAVATLSALVRTSLLIIGALFPIINPLGNAPIFLSLTSGYPGEVRTAIARRVAINGFCLLVVSVLIGTHILAFFGISLPVVQVGGGMVVVATGWSLLTRSDDEDSERSGAKSTQPSELADQAFYPLTLPLTVGPGSISVAITVGANHAPGSETSWFLPVAALLGSSVLGLSIYLSYRFAESIARVLGATAMNVILRLSSFILLCIGVQIAWNGVSELLGSVVRFRA